MGPGKNFVIDRPPLRELAQIIDNALRIRAEIMRAVIVNEYTRLIAMIISIAGDVVTALDHEAGLAELTGNPLCQDRAGKASANDQEIKRGRRQKRLRS